MTNQHHSGASQMLANAQRIVIKIGSALLFDSDAGSARQDWMQALAQDIAQLKAQNKEVILVSSGSIALGRQILGLKKGGIGWRRNRQLQPQDRLVWFSTGQMRSCIIVCTQHRFCLPRKIQKHANAILMPVPP